MTDPLEPATPRRHPADTPTLRRCLRCQATFPSEGFGERICRDCKSSKSWRDASRFMSKLSFRR